MGSRASLNKVMLIGNLTRDPELRYTPSGAAVCTFGIATNRFYVASDGTKREEAEFIKIVAWNKLAELCSQLLSKGRKVYVEGRLQTRTWETPDGQSRQTTEVVIDDMRILDPKRDFDEASVEETAIGGDREVKEHEGEAVASREKTDVTEEGAKDQDKKPAKGRKNVKGAVAKNEPEKPDEEKDQVNLEDLPF